MSLISNILRVCYCYQRCIYTMNMQRNHISKQSSTKESNNLSAHKTKSPAHERSTCGRTYVLSTVSTIQTCLGNDWEFFWGGGASEWPTLLFMLWQLVRASATIFTCARLKALQRLHMNGSHTGNVTSLIFGIKLRRCSCQPQISPLYPADKRQSNKVYNCEVKH